MDFGDSCSSLVIRIIQMKFLALMCKHKLTKHIIVHGGYADNDNGSFESFQEYRLVKEDMETAHRKIGLPLKHTYTSTSTDSKILDQLSKSEEDVPVYNFLGMKWNIHENSFAPNSYFAMGKRRGGLKTRMMIMELFSWWEKAFLVDYW